MRKLTSKMLCLIVAVSLSITAMTACGGSSSKGTTGTAATTAAGETTAAAEVKEQPVEKAEFTFLSCWNGGGGGFPQDQVNNPVAKRIEEKIGVTVKLESITTNEAEKLNTMFASGLVPDLVNAPCWTTINQGEGAIIRKAAAEGQILALDPYLDKYPNVKKLLEVGVAKDFNEFELHHPDFQGKTYLIPQQTPDGTPESVTNWNGGVYARGDILKALNIKPEDIDTSDEFYDLLVKIKNGNFKDISGKPVIPAGTRHNGWDYPRFLDFWSDYTISDFRMEEGKLTYWMFTKDQENRLIYMRKLIKDGLFDLEAFNNTDTMAKEKLSVGKLAVFADHSGMDVLAATLYKTNPEMKYELLGPFKNKSGNIATQVEKKGRSGFPVMFLGASTKNADAVLRFIDYVNSDEGHLLAYYGIEGEHYTLENGKPKWIPDVKKKFDADPNLRRDAGIGYLQGFIGAFSDRTAWPVPVEELSQWDRWNLEYGAKIPVQFVDKVSANYLSLDWPQRQKFLEDTSTVKFEDEIRKAYFAKSDEEALKILNSVREKFRNAGAQEMADYVAKKAAERNDVGF